MKQPLGLAALLFSAGILLADKIRVSPFWPALAAIIFLALSIAAVRSRRCCAFFLCLWLFFAGGLALRSAYILSACHMAKIIPYPGKEEYVVKGYINDEPLRRRGRLTFVLRSHELQAGKTKYNCCGDILVYLTTDKKFDYGQELLVSGRITRPFTFGGASAKAFGEHLRRRGIYLVMRGLPAGPQIPPGRSRGFFIKRMALGLKEKIEKLILRHMGALSAGILDAMLLGEKRFIPAAVYGSMVKSGTVHILVVSGFNVGVVAFSIATLLKLLRFKKRPRIFITAALLIFYCLMAGASNPVVRATVMAEVFLFSWLFKREADIYNSLGASALLILMVYPRQLFDPGFQLSFASVFSIAFIYPRLKTLLRLGAVDQPFFKGLAEAFLVSFSAWLGTAFLVLYYFRLFSAVAPVANIFIVPLAGLITLCGFSLILTAFLLPCLTPFFACASEFLIALLLKINGLLITLPFAYTRLP